MSNICYYGCGALSEQELVVCNQYLLGGITAWAFVRCDQEFADITAAAEWLSKIAAGTVTVFKKVSGNIPYETPATIDSPVACEEPIRVGASHTAVITDANVTPNNMLNYPSLNTTRGYVVFYNCSTDTIYYQLSKQVSFDAKFTLPQTNKEIQMFQIDMAWSNSPLQIADAPDGIFTS